MWEDHPHKALKILLNEIIQTTRLGVFLQEDYPHKNIWVFLREDHPNNMIRSLLTRRSSIQKGSEVFLQEDHPHKIYWSSSKRIHPNNGIRSLLTRRSFTQIFGGFLEWNYPRQKDRESSYEKIIQTKILDFSCKKIIQSSEGFLSMKESNRQSTIFECARQS